MLRASCWMSRALCFSRSSVVAWRMAVLMRLQAEQILFRDHADKTALVGDQHVTYALLGHRQCRFMGRRMWRQGRELGAHDTDHRLIKIDLRQGHAAQNVVQGEDALRDPVVDGNHGAHPVVLHHLQGLPDGVIR
jgi:hypothetical protein